MSIAEGRAYSGNPDPGLSFSLASPESARSVKKPFVGLRPFDTEDSHLFFGRREQTHELLQRLFDSHFVAAVGGSGCGKSSLVRAGLIPALEAGFLVADRDTWEIFKIKPGEDPLCNLASALLPASTDLDAVLSLADRLQKSKVRGVIECLQPYLDENKNVLILVDQFEETFLFGRRCGDEGREKASVFVSTLLSLAQKADLPIYVVITMRADFVGDCAAYPGFAEAMNRSLYLVPRLTRQQRREAIEGPIRMGGAAISPRLLDRLLNESEMESDQLPVLQHALMRTWEEWRKDGSAEDGDLADASERLIEAEHYERAGTLKNALNAHAEEALQASDPELVRRIFQALTDTDSANRQIRRPARMSELQAVTGATRRALQEVVDRFRSDNRCFLMVSHGVSPEDPLIDVSHESLIRRWEKLKEWVDEEAESAETYRRLEVETARYLRGKAGLWNDEPGLQGTLDWLHKNPVNVAWAARVRPSEIFQTPPWVRPTFEQVLEFLEDSHAARDGERKRRAAEAEELARVREEKLAKVQELAESRKKGIVWIGSLSALLLGFTIIYIYLWWRSNKIVEASTLAHLSLASAQTDPQRSLLFATEAFLRQQAANEDGKEPENALRYALSVTGGRGLGGFRKGISSLTLSGDGRRLIAGSLNGSLASWDLTASRPEMTKAVLRPESKIGKQEKNEGVLVATARDRIVFRADDGTLHIQGRDRLLSQPAGTTRVSAFALTPDGHWLVAGDEQHGALWRYDLSDPSLPAPEAIRPPGLPRKGRPQPTILKILVSPDGTWVASLDTYQHMELWHIQAGLGPTQARREEKISAFDMNGTWLAVGRTDGGIGALSLTAPQDPWIPMTTSSDHGPLIRSVVLRPSLLNTPEVFATNENSEILALRFDSCQPSLQEPQAEDEEITLKVSPDGRWLVARGNSLLRLFQLDGHPGEGVSFSLHGHAGPVNDFAFTPDSRRLFTGGVDGTVRMWDLTLPDPSNSGIVHRAHGFKAQKASLSADLRWLVSWDGQNGVLQRSRLGGPADDKRLPVTGKLSDMKISSDDHLLATISSGDSQENRTTLTLWDLETAAGFVPKEGVSAVDLIDGGENFRLVSGGAADGKVKFWARGPAGLSPEPERVVDVYRKERSLPNYKDPRILAVTVTPHQKRLVVSDSDAGSHLCDLSAASSECRRLKDRFYLTFAKPSPDGHWLLALARDGSARVLDLQGKSPEFKNLLVRSAVTAVVFGQKNQLFLGTSDGVVSWYDLGRASSFDSPMPPLALLMDRDSPISSLALNPDEDSLAVGSVHSTVRIWNVSKKPEWRPDHSTTLFNSMHLPVGDHDEVILKVLFSKDKRNLVAVSETGVVRWWDLSDDALLKQAEATAGRNMSRKEWIEALPDVSYPKTFKDLPEGFQ